MLFDASMQFRAPVLLQKASMTEFGTAPVHLSTASVQLFSATFQQITALPLLEAASAQF
ncbi:MAG: hypothetical protein L6Q69_19545 [Zoogloea sp.]|jgi:hypothetical protein|nr:hypothetical protein [Zoogloea sp.]